MKLFRNNTKMCINLSFVAVKVLLIFVIAIPRIGFFHTIATNVIFGKFSTFSAISKISKTVTTNVINNKTLELDSLHYQACVAKVLKKSLEPFWRFSKKR